MVSFQWVIQGYGYSSSFDVAAVVVRPISGLAIAVVDEASLPSKK